MNKSYWDPEWKPASGEKPPTYKLVQVLGEGERWSYGWWSGSVWDWGVMRHKGSVRAWRHLPGNCATKNP